MIYGGGQFEKFYCMRIVMYLQYNIDSQYSINNAGPKSAGQVCNVDNPQTHAYSLDLD